MKDEFVIEDGILKQYTGHGNEVVLPEGIVEIGEKCFKEKIFIQSISIPDGVKSIGDSAFEQCIDLEHVQIPDTVQTIGKYAFYGCKHLREMTLPFITEIHDYTFS